MRTKLIAAATSGCILLSAGFAAGFPGIAGATPAPPSNADAVAVRVAPLLAISHTHATAGATGGASSAKANVLELQGNTLLEGGVQNGVGTKKGALLDTGTTALGPVLDLKVTPWNATVTATDTHRHAEAYAAVLTLVLMNEKTLFVKLLQSSSSADHDDTTLESSSAASSDGAVVGLGGQLTIDVLHSEASSKNGGSSYLVSINGTEIGSDEQAASIPLCSLSVSTLLQLTCLKVTGGKGSNNSATDATAIVNQGSAQGDISNVSSSTGKGTAEAAVTPTTQAPAPAPVVEAAQLPRTGVSSLAIALYGLFLVALGAAAVFAAKARRRLSAVA